MSTDTTSPITEQVVAVQTLDVKVLIAEYERMFGHAPRCRNRVWLWRNVAWKIQEAHYGGLSPAAQARLEQLISEIRIPTEPPCRTTRVRVNKPGAQVRPTPGTTLTRTWHGCELRVTVLEHGLEFEGQVFRSLSAIARHVTGVGWNGPAFFGLRERSADP